MSSLQSTMKSLQSKQTGALARQIQSIFLHSDANSFSDTIPGASLQKTSQRIQTTFLHTSTGKIKPTINQKTCKGRCICTGLPMCNKQKLANKHFHGTKMSKAKWYATPMTEFNDSTSNSRHDLRRYLKEIGTDTKQAGFWLKQFQQVVEPYRPFGVIEVDPEIFKNHEMLNTFASCLSFLHRNDMKCVVVYGLPVTPGKSLSPQDLQNFRAQLLTDSMMLVSVLESHGAPTRPFFSGSNILHAQPRYDFSMEGELVEINSDPIKWSLCSGHIPIILSIGESPTGQLLTLDVTNVTTEVSKALQPFKVMFLNAAGGITNTRGEVVANFNLPEDMNTVLGEDLCTRKTHKTMKNVNNLLSYLSTQASVVITSADSLLTELFTHRGSGTFFKKSEPVYSLDSYNGVDQDKLTALINRSYGRKMNDNYLSTVKEKLHTLYYSKDGTVAAVVNNEPHVSVPYLDKFAVDVHSRDEGLEETLWKHLTRDFKQLFWRSRGTNKNNAWYFKNSEGSWSNGTWTVFWYGVSDTLAVTELIDHALSLPDSFINHSSETETANTVLERKNMIRE